MAIPFAAMAGMGGPGGFSSLMGAGGLSSMFSGSMGAGGAAGGDIWAQLAAILGKQPPGQGAQATKGKMGVHENITAKVNDSFNSLRAFGESMRGADMTPLNNIPRNSAQVIMPQNNQNPGITNLQALMAMIAGGAR